MKTFSIYLVLTFSCFNVFSQNILFSKDNIESIKKELESKNKKELKDFIIDFITQCEAIFNESTDQIVSLKEKVENLNSSLLNTNNEIKKNLEANQKIKANLQNIENKNIELYNEKISLKDSINKLIQEIIALNSDSNISNNHLNNPDDFLNNYYAFPKPLNLNSFELVFEKIMFFDNQDRNNSYNYRYNSNFVDFVPENISVVDNFEISRLNPVKLKRSSPNGNYLYPMENFAQSIISRPIKSLEELLPRIEILKNKLVTFKYPDGKEESFLFNSEKNKKNNFRDYITFTLSNEDLDQNKDIIWNIFVIGNEAFLALNKNQINRLGINLTYIPTTWSKNSYISLSDNSIEPLDGLFISRTIDAYMDNGYFLNPENLIYLFKLKEI